MPRWYYNKRCHIPKRVRIAQTQAVQDVIAQHCKGITCDTIEEKVAKVVFANLLNMAAKEGIVILPPGALDRVSPNNVQCQRSSSDG